MRKTCASSVVCLAARQQMKGALKRSALRTQQCPRSVWQPGPNCGSEKVCIHWLRCHVLPAMLRGGGVVIIEQRGWPEASCEVIPRGWGKPCINQSLASSKCTPRPKALHFANHDNCDFWVALAHHFEGVAPTRPTGRVTDALCAHEAQSSQRQWQTRDVPCDLGDLCLQQYGQTTAQRTVLSAGEITSGVRRKCPQQEICPRGSTEEENQPRCLQVWD